MRAGGGGKIRKLRAKLVSVKLMRRYGIFIADDCKIGVGLTIVHPAGIFITNASIGENFTVYQNCTIGRKTKDAQCKAGYITLGNNLTMYAGSMIIGNDPVVDNVTVGAGALLLKGADKAGIYVGNPAKRITDRKDS